MVAFIGGILLSSVAGGVSVSLSNFALLVFSAVIVGGLESIPGAIVGGITVGAVEFLAGGYLDPLIARGTVREVAPFIVLLLVIIIRPNGFFGQHEIERV